MLKKDLKTIGINSTQKGEKLITDSGLEISKGSYNLWQIKCGELSVNFDSRYLARKTGHITLKNSSVVFGSLKGAFRGERNGN